MTAKDALIKIINDKGLVCGPGEVSDARIHAKRGLSSDERKRFFSAVCFTETPLDEIHCLLDIMGRRVNLQPYGLVLLKEAAIVNGVEPVWYLNNTQGDKDPAVKALCWLIEQNPDAAAQVLPLVSIFGIWQKTPD